MKNKRYLKARTEYILRVILMDLLSPEEARKVTVADVYKQFPKVTYYKKQDTGEIRVGLSHKGVRKLIKKYPTITPAGVKMVFNLG